MPWLRSWVVILRAWTLFFTSIAHLIRGSVGAQALLLPIRRRIKEKNKKKQVPGMWYICVSLAL